MNTTINGAPAPAVFHFQELPVAVILKDGDPWFVASEVCRSHPMHELIKTAVSHETEHNIDQHKGPPQAVPLDAPVRRATGA